MYLGKLDTLEAMRMLANTDTGTTVPAARIVALIFAPNGLKMVSTTFGDDLVKHYFRSHNTMVILEGSQSPKWRFVGGFGLYLVGFGGPV